MGKHVASGTLAKPSPNKNHSRASDTGAKKQSPTKPHVPNDTRRRLEATRVIQKLLTNPPKLLTQGMEALDAMGGKVISSALTAYGIPVPPTLTTEVLRSARRLGAKLARKVL